jgi:hypothetical protein
VRPGEVQPADDRARQRVDHRAHRRKVVQVAAFLSTTTTVSQSV